MSVNPRSIAIFTLDENDKVHIDLFNCEDDEMNRFFREECLNEQDFGLNKTYVLYYNGKLAAFCSICADRISLKEDEVEEAELPRKSVPAVKVARLGRDVKYRELKLGRYLLEYVQLKVLELSDESLGVRFITLDAYPHRVSYYESIGFIQNGQQDKRKDTVSMRFDIFSLDSSELKKEESA